MENNKILSVNIDHIATLRNARNSKYPNLLEAVQFVKNAGAEIVTIHLREDRRHIKDKDAFEICKANILPINLEIAPTKEMIDIALKLKPKYVCLVPENRKEITTEGGLDVCNMQAELTKIISILQENNIEVSLFIEPNIEQIKYALKCKANTIELHTGKFAEFEEDLELLKLKQASEFAFKNNLNVHAGHGLTYKTARIIKQELKEVSILHIGHFLMVESLMQGLMLACSKMKNIFL